MHLQVELAIGGIERQRYFGSILITRLIQNERIGETRHTLRPRLHVAVAAGGERADLDQRHRRPRPGSAAAWAALIGDRRCRAVGSAHVRGHHPESTLPRPRVEEAARVHRRVNEILRRVTQGLGFKPRTLRDRGAGQRVCQHIAQAGERPSQTRCQQMIGAQAIQDRPQLLVTQTCF